MQTAIEKHVLIGRLGVAIPLTIDGNKLFAESHKVPQRLGSGNSSLGWVNISYAAGSGPSKSRKVGILAIRNMLRLTRKETASFL